MPRVSIVIPVGPAHAECVVAAIQSCLNQTVTDIEVVISDDTGFSSPLVEKIHDKLPAHAPVKYTWDADHHKEGVSGARNRGIRSSLGDFVMFLDADDTIDPTKVERQLAELARYPDHDWCLCDVRIKEPDGRVEYASSRYDYASKELGGWIYDTLRDGNFIPVMSPLVRRSLLLEHDIRFDDRLVPEDYHFWRKVAKVGRVRYVPEVLATYIKSRNGRNASSAPAWKRFNPTFTPPLRLNLGCGTQGTRSWHPIDGFYNLDKSMGWKFEDGLGDFADETVAGITISHALMYVPDDAWGFVFSEFYRVLEPGGVIRITEDEALLPQSGRFGGWKGSDPAITLTGYERLWDALRVVLFDALDMPPDASRYRDNSLIQQQHGNPPDVFFIEGVKRA